MVRRSLGVLVGLAVGAAVLVGCSLPGRGGVDGYHLTARFESAVGLYPHGDVHVMGVPVGTVDAVELEDDHVRVEMTIGHHVPLPADVRATIEPLTLIGERNVVLFPPWDAAMAAEGRARLQDGGEIPVERTEVPVEPDEALAAFNELAESLEPATLGELIGDSAVALEGLGDDLGIALDQGSAIAGSLAAVDQQLVGAADALHRLAATLSTREEQLGALVRTFSDATSVLAEERDGIGRFLTSIVDLTEQGQDLLTLYGDRLPADLAHLAALAMVLERNADSAEQLIGAFPRVAEAIADGYQPEIGGIYLRANATPTIVGLLDVFRDLLGVLPGQVP